MRRKGLMMKTIHNTKIIGIDHGYGNMKTTNFCFPTGITAYDHEPLFTADMLIYNGRYYLIGEGHKEFIAEKGYDKNFGARPLKRAIQKYLEDELAEMILKLNAESCLGGAIEAVKSKDGDEEKLALTYVPLLPAEDAADSEIKGIESN